MARRPHPHVAIPSGAAPPTNPSPSSSWSSHLYQSPPQDSSDGWGDYGSSRYSSTLSIPSISFEGSSYPSSRPSSFYEQESSRITFPEPQLYRSASQRSSLRPSPTTTHRATRSELTVSNTHSTGESRPPSFISTDSSPELSVRELSDELSSLTLQSEDGLHRFQAGQLPETDSEWYRLVPPEAREVLDSKEVQRQSILFEIIKSERDYVSDLQLIKEIYIDPLMNTCPMPQHRLEGFISEVFYNLDSIQAHHQQLRDALFARQLDQHPLVQSIADIILSSILDQGQLFRTEYEKYIKHYPLARARHTSELKHNSKYNYFIQQCSLDPRMRKLELGTLLYRPVTRLPRLKLQLETVLKRTAPDHPDMEDLPPILDVLEDLVKSTQPGIEVSEGKVSFWDLCESLVYQKGEILDLDLYDESRTLVYSGPLARRYRSEMGYNWADLHVALLDNYLLLMKPESRPGGATRHSVISRPIPLEYLRLATFDGLPENRRDAGFLESFRSRSRPMYPFTVYHASAKMNRRYTLYAASDHIRQKWYAAMVDALGVRKVQQDANMWFAPHVMNETFFRYSTLVSSGALSGKITAAAPFTSGGNNFIAVGCSSGVYVALRGEADFRKVLDLPNPSSIVALPDFHKILILSDDGLSSYSLDLLARVSLGHASQEHLDATLERIAGQDGTILFFRAGRIGSRTMVLYTSKSFLQVTFHAFEVLRTMDASISPRRSISGTLSNLTYRSFGEPLAIPKDSHDIISLHRSVGICTDKGIWIVDPTNPSMSSVNPTVIPKFSGAENHAPMATLKTRCASAKPLGLVRCHDEEILIIYDELGCYVDKHGVPSRKCGYLRWETKATAFIHRGDHILLFSAEFIEIRTVQTGRLVQVIEGEDVRLAYRGLLPADRTTLVAMKGREESGTVFDKIVELVETAELTTPRGTKMQAMWDEWDM